MNKIERKINRTVQLAKNVRLHRADGGETDPMLNQDTSIYNNPYKDQVLSAPEPMTMGQYLAQAMRKPHETNIRDFPQDFQNLAVVQGIKQLPEQIWESVKYPTMALKGELQRGIDPHTGQVTGVTESGMGPTEAGMVGAGLVSAGAMPDIAAGRVTPNVMRAGSPVETTVGAVKAPRSDLGFYSHGSETAANLPQAKGTAEQMVSMLRKAGVKPVELENAGLIDAAGNIHPDWAGKPVTREELSQHLHQSMPQVEETLLSSKANKYPYRDADEWQDAISRAERRRDFDEAQRLTLAWEEAEGIGQAGSPKFQQYTLPGGENYRELLLKLPETWTPKIQEKYGRFGFEGPDGQYRDYWTKSDAEQAARSFKRESGSFQSTHWNEPDVLAHVRMSDRVGPNGEKLLHVEEMQSDWGQRGRDEGFRNPAKPYEVFDSKTGDVLGKFKTAEDAESFTKNYSDNPFLDWEKSKGPVAGPYVTSTQGWTDLALKRVMKEAAEGGYDGVVFTPGAEQAKRYDLSKQVSHISYDPNTNYLQALDHNGRPAINKKVPPEKLVDYVGKDVAEKLLATDPNNLAVHSLEGQDLTLGGEGMTGYYDKIVPSRLKELMKGHDKDAKLGKIGTNQLPEMLHMPMTDKMRQSILSGQRAFNEGGRVGFVTGGSIGNLKMGKNDDKVEQSVNLAKELNRSSYAYGGFPEYTPSYTLDNSLFRPTSPIPRGMAFSPVHILSKPSSDIKLPQPMTPYFNAPGATFNQPKIIDQTPAPGTTSVPGIVSPTVVSAAPSSIVGGSESDSTSFPTIASSQPPVDYSNLTAGSPTSPGPFSPVGPMTGPLDVPPLSNLDLYQGSPIIPRPPEPTPAPTTPTATDTGSGQQWEGGGGGGDHGDYGGPSGPSSGASPGATEATTADATGTIGGNYGGGGDGGEGDGGEGDGGEGDGGEGDGGGGEGGGGEGGGGEGGGGGERYGGAITMRRYRANGGPIRVSPRHAEAGPSKVSPAQANAGNYKKKHLNFQGLPLSIETPKGHVREKIINGKLDWRVKMPVDYGYVKGTKDHDGDASDVFVGPHKKSDKVWVIDQADHRTGKFDEHKAMLGFKHKHKALKAYKDSFSDGKGHKRIMDATKMSVQEYKDWIKHGDLKKPVSSSPFIQKALMVASKKS